MKKVLILGHMDGFANGEKPREVKSYLEKHGHQVILMDTTKIQRLYIDQQGQPAYASSRQFGLGNILLHPLIRFREIYSGSDNWLVLRFLFVALILEVRVRAMVLQKLMKQMQFDLLLCESQLDSYVLQYPIAATTWYDCATPWAEELLYGQKILPFEYKILLKEEIDIYSQADYLSFHWDVYADYVKKYFYTGKNIVTLNAGTYTKTDIAHFASPPKLVYLGFLGGYWINLPLLSKLTKLYPHIDVYGAPKPEAHYGLNYKGYAPPTVLSKYQFGLITISNDRLRNEGFSAKHVEYLSYGLPVLVPEWRTSAQGLKGTIFYNEDNFLEIIKKYSKEQTWAQMSKLALSQAKKFNWDDSLAPLLDVVNALP